MKSRPANAVQKTRLPVETLTLDHPPGAGYSLRMKFRLRSLPAGTALLLACTAAADIASARPVAGRASVSAEGPRGGSYEASGARVGRFGAGSVSAEGPHGGTYGASVERGGPYHSANVSAEGPNGGSVSRSSTTWTGYRSGYVYRSGVYHSANVVVNTAYVAPVGVYAGWSVIALPT